ncbi:MAG: OmpH family outer membrane protein [Phycisphaerales bacterium JB052]
MKRLNSLTLLTLFTLIALVGMLLFASKANANRSFGLAESDMASVDVFSLVDRALSGDEMTAERRSFEAESNAAIEALQQQLVQLQTQLGALSPDDPNGGQLYQQYQQLQGQLQQASQAASLDYQTLIAEQIAQGYREIYAAVNEIAAEQGYTFVFATRSDGELLQTDTINGITQEILARPLVTPPSATDLTEAVRIKLGYPEEIAEEANESTEGEAQVDGEPDDSAAPTDGE